MATTQKNMITVISSLNAANNTKVRVSSDLSSITVINGFRSVPDAELSWDKERHQYLVRLMVTPDEQSQKCGAGYSVMAIKGLLSASDFVHFYRILVRHRANKKK